LSAVSRYQAPVTGWPALALTCGLLAGCSQPAPPAPVAEQRAPNDAQHQGINEPHGDHSAHHGGMVLMNGEVHYEVVLDAAGRYELWLSDAVRTELPASIASNVTVTVSRPNAEPEVLKLMVDDAGESWVGTGKPVTGDAVMVKVNYDLRGEPHEVEIPFVPAKR
jgi:hypothetical protein